MIGFGILVGTLSHPVLYLHGVLAQRSPSSDFGENQLSRGLISLSLLLSSHLRIFQHPRVRSFTWCYPGFTTDNNSQTHYAKGRPSPRPFDCRQMPSMGRSIKLMLMVHPRTFNPNWYSWSAAKWTWLRHLVCIRLQVLFHSPSRGSFHLSLAVLVHYRLPRSI